MELFYFTNSVTFPSYLIFTLKRRLSTMSRHWGRGAPDTHHFLCSVCPVEGGGKSGVRRSDFVSRRHPSLFPYNKLVHPFKLITCLTGKSSGVTLTTKSEVHRIAQLVCSDLVFQGRKRWRLILGDVLEDLDVLQNKSSSLSDGYTLVQISLLPSTFILTRN